MDMLMQQNLKPFTDFLIALGIDRVSHTQKTYLGHLVNVYRLMESHDEVAGGGPAIVEAAHGAPPAGGAGR